MTLPGHVTDSRSVRSNLRCFFLHRRGGQGGFFACLEIFQPDIPISRAVRYKDQPPAVGGETGSCIKGRVSQLLRLPGDLALIGVDGQAPDVEIRGQAGENQPPGLADGRLVFLGGPEGQP